MTSWEGQSWDEGASWSASGGNDWNNSWDDKSWDTSANGYGQPPKAAAADEHPASTEDWGTSAPADPWKNSSSGWGSSEMTANAADVNLKPPAKEFWEEQAWNKQSNVLSKLPDWQLEQNDAALFHSRLGDSAGIDFGRYAQVPVDLSGNKSTNIPVCETFHVMLETFGELMSQALMDNIQRCKYSTPTPVQKYAIPVGLVGRDIMCCAQTGSGKTAAFLIPVIGRMMKHHQDPVGNLTEPFEGPCSPDTVIISPTRELCIQIHEEAQKFCHRTPYLPGVLYGGAPTKEQMKAIATGKDVIVATPGRLKDFIDRGIVSVEQVNVLVLDEADRMLDMGFEPQIRAIVEEHNMPIKDNRQTMMFSATFAEKCQQMAQDFLFDYIWIGVGVIGGAVDTVDQQLLQVTPKEKFDKLIEVLDRFFAERDVVEDKLKKPRALVFTNAKDTAKFLDEQLYESMKIDTGALHGNLTQYERENNLKRFRAGEIDVMIATDVASRGLDIENVSLVVNYDMPTELDSYIHRIGRTGRIGNRGQAVTFISVEDESSLEHVETLKGLVKIIKDAGKTIPSWLEGLCDGSRSSSGWKYGGKDYRSGTAAAESSDWSNWQGSSDWKNNNADSWEKDDKWTNNEQW